MKGMAYLQCFALLAGAGILTVVATFSCSTDQAMRTAVENTQPNVAPTSQEVSIESVRLASLRSDTIAQLTAKGLPPAAPPRKKVFEQTAKQSTPEVVRDLGNFFAMANCSNRNTGHPLEDVARWAATIPPNVKVARLIEEGRKAPEDISALIRAEIARCLDGYDKKRDARDEVFIRYVRNEGPAPSIGENDKLYETTRCYSDPLYEYNRIHYVVYSGLYILANIERPDEQLLRQWLALRKAKNTECLAMDAWLVLAFRKSPGVETMKMSAWNSPWLHNDPFILMAKVDASSLPTFNVLAIPSEPFEDEVIAKILDGFREKK
jgi:hypothetical protein